jgi:hypothetical protein
MTTLTFSVGITVLAAIAVLFASRLRMLRAAVSPCYRPAIAERYKPMLRLLGNDDLEFVGKNKELRARLQAQRHRIFRDYLRCLTKEYGQLMAGIRMVVVQSATDRSDLVRMIARNQMYFVMALCRVEIRLALYRFGLCSVDASGLVQTMEAMRNAHANLLAPSPAAFAL